MLSVFKSPHSITAACMLSFAFSSTGLKDWIYNPITTTFWTVLCGGIAGNIITDLPPVPFRPYVAGGILGLSLFNAGARYLGFLPPRKNTPFVYINMESGSDFSQNRISYTVHNHLENIGPTLVVKDTLNVENIMTILNEHGSELDFHINIALNTIKDTLTKSEFLDKVSGVFIHGASEGYVMIKTQNSTSDQVMSIRI